LHDGLFSEFIEEIIEVFMDDFSVYGKTFMNCLANLDKVLMRCAEVDLVLNWEKCHCRAYTPDTHARKQED
jgi:hypothetical protein